MVSSHGIDILMRFNAGTTSLPASRVIRVAPPLKLTSVSSSLALRATTGSPIEVTDRDALLNRVTGSQVSDYRMRAEVFGGVAPQTITWTSSNPSIATVDSQGLASYVSTGEATISATVAGQTQGATLSFYSQGAQNTDTLISYVIDSVSSNATLAVDSRLVGKSASTALAVFTTQNHATSSYVRNAGCWAADLDLTSISPWNSSTANLFGLVAIASDIVIGCAHAFPSVGSTVRFIAADNSVVERTMISAVTHPNFIPYYPDLRIGRLSSALPGTIGIAKILPASWQTKIPALGFGRTLPALCLDQEEKALVTDFVLAVGYANFSFPFLLNAEKRAEFYEDKVGGDSGNPAFLIINDELVLLTCWTFGGAGTGTFVSDHISAINTMISGLGSSSTLTQIDLSSFNTY